MGVTIHPTAIIAPDAELGTNVEVGPFSIIGPNCSVGDGSGRMIAAGLHGNRHNRVT